MSEWTLQPENYNEDGGVVSCADDASRRAAARAAFERDATDPNGPFAPRPERVGTVHTYNPRNIRLTFGGVEIRGFAEAEIVTDHGPRHPGFDPNFSGVGSLSITLVQHGRLHRVTTRRQRIRAARRHRKLRRGWA